MSYRLRRSSRAIPAALAIAAIAAIIIGTFPAVAQAPDAVTVKPLASCEAGKCVMSEKDFKTLQKFHADRVASILAANELIDALQAQNAALMHMIARDAAGCKGNRT